MRRLLLAAVLVAACRGEAQKRDQWSWGAESDEVNPKEAKKVSGRSASLHSPPGAIPLSPNLGPHPGPGLHPAPGPHLAPAGHHLSPASGHQFSPATVPHLSPAPVPHLSPSPVPHLSPAPALGVQHAIPTQTAHPAHPAPASIAPVVTGHQQRGEHRSITVAGHGDGKSEGRFLGIKEKLCEVGLAYDVSTGACRLLIFFGRMFLGV